MMRICQRVAHLIPSTGAGRGARGGRPRGGGGLRRLPLHGGGVRQADPLGVQGVRAQVPLQALPPEAEADW